MHCMPSMVSPKILLPVFFFPRSFRHNCLKNPPPELLPPWHYFSLVLPPDSPSPHNSSCFQLNRDCSRSLCQTLLPMQPHVCNWNSAAVPATPGSERAREPGREGRAPRCFAQHRSWNQCFSSETQHKQSFELLCCLSFWPSSSTGIQQLAFVTVCDGTQNVERYRYQDFFPVPNIFATDTGTFFGTKFYRYRFRDFFPVPNFSDTGSDTTRKNEKFPVPVPIRYRYQEFFIFAGGFGTGIGIIWYRKKVSESVLVKFGTEKSTGIDIGNIWYRKKSIGII